MKNIHIIIICLEYKTPEQARQSQAPQRFWPLFDFDEAASEQLHAPDKAGLAGVIWWMLLTIMALCGNFAGAVEFAQMAGQSLASLWSFWTR